MPPPPLPPPAAAVTAAAATIAAPQGGSAGVSAPPPALLLPGGLAGFAGRTWAAVPSVCALPPCLIAWDPALCGSGGGCWAAQLPPPQHTTLVAAGFGEGLAGLTGALGAGLRVLCGLAQACSPDAAQGLLQLWRHVSGVAGGSPPEQVREAMVETMAAAVCAGACSTTQADSSQSHSHGG